MTDKSINKSVIPKIPTLYVGPLPPGTPNLICQEHGIKPDFSGCITCMLLWPKEKQK